jgi:peptidyl-prolyl cis-trans isomerase B (cyclophilin B)
MKISRWLVGLLTVSLLVVTTACNAADRGSEISNVPGAQGSIPMNQRPYLDGTATVVLQVKGQPVTIQVDGTNAPITAGNFVDLVQRGVYNGTAFHRVVRQPEPFVVQGGDPESQDPQVPLDALGTGNFIDPTTNQPRYIPLEIKPEGAAEPVYSQTLKTARVSSPPVLRHQRGAVAMARTMMPNSASAQFYVALAELPFLDGDYAVFGTVTQGMEVVDQIQEGDRIESATVTQGLENLKSTTDSAAPSP